MKRHSLEPEATGAVGHGAEWTQNAAGQRVQSAPLRCEFVGWLGDDLVSVWPDFIISGALADALRSSDLTGYELGEAIITKSSEYVSRSGALPSRWERFVPTGDEGSADDIALQDGDLLLSERALALFNDSRITEARLRTDAPDSPEAHRFVRQRDAARAADALALEAERVASDTGQQAEASRIMAALATGPSHEQVPPTLRTATKREIAGDLTLAIAALGGTIDEQRVLAVLRLVDGAIEVDDLGQYGATYRGVDGSLNVHFAKNGTVKGVEFVFRPHGNAPDASYPRSASVIIGVDPLTRAAVRECLGELVRSKHGSKTNTWLDEYRVHRKRVLTYWTDDEPKTIIVGTKA